MAVKNSVDEFFHAITVAEQVTFRRVRKIARLDRIGLELESPRTSRAGPLKCERCCRSFHFNVFECTMHFSICYVNSN